MSDKKKVILRRITVFLLAAVLTLTITQCGSPQNLNHFITNLFKADELKVHFIDVGQGDAILIENDDNDMLIDAGDNNAGNIVTDYLRAEKIEDLDYVICTHPHSDHIGGMDTVLDNFDSDNVIIPPTDYETKSFKDVLHSIRTKNLTVIYAKAGDKYKLGKASFVILAPNSSSYDDLNNYSICIKVTFGKNSFLLTGDAEEISEREMLAKGYDLSADVLKLAHHGSAYSSCNDFLNAVHPEYGVISAGVNNDYGHPHLRTLRALRKHGINIYRTDKQGTIIFTSNGKKITVNKPVFEAAKTKVTK